VSRRTKRKKIRKMKKRMKRLAAKAVAGVDLEAETDAAVVKAVAIASAAKDVTRTLDLGLDRDLDPGGLEIEETRIGLAGVDAGEAGTVEAVAAGEEGPVAAAVSGEEEAKIVSAGEKKERRRRRREEAKRRALALQAGGRNSVLPSLRSLCQSLLNLQLLLQPRRMQLQVYQMEVLRKRGRSPSGTKWVPRRLACRIG